MIASKHVHLIEVHGDRIIQSVSNQIRRDPELAHIEALLSAELGTWGRDLLEHVGHWLSKGLEEDLGHRYQRIGRQLFDSNVPLYQCLRCLFITREKVTEFLEQELPSATTMDVYAEEESERRLVRFFDFLAINMTRGYERGLQKTAGAA